MVSPQAMEETPAPTAFQNEPGRFLTHMSRSNSNEPSFVQERVPTSSSVPSSSSSSFVPHPPSLLTSAEPQKDPSFLRERVWGTHREPEPRYDALVQNQQILENQMKLQAQLQQQIEELKRLQELQGRKKRHSREDSSDEEQPPLRAEKKRICQTKLIPGPRRDHLSWRRSQEEKDFSPGVTREPPIRHREESRVSIDSDLLSTPDERAAMALSQASQIADLFYLKGEPESSSASNVQYRGERNSESRPPSLSLPQSRPPSGPQSRPQSRPRTYSPLHHGDANKENVVRYSNFRNIMDRKREKLKESFSKGSVPSAPAAQALQENKEDELILSSQDDSALFDQAFF